MSSRGKRKTYRTRDGKANDFGLGQFNEQIDTICYPWASSLVAYHVNILSMDKKAEIGQIQKPQVKQQKASTILLSR